MARLRNPGRVDAALATVEQVRSELENAQSHGNNAAQRLDAFLTWCDHWGKPQLGNHFPAEWGLFDALDESYHRLALAPEMPDRRLNGLLNREFATWHRRLTDVSGNLRELKGFIQWPGRIVVPDTSAVMEGAFFTRFDWRTLHDELNVGPVRLIVPALVVEELDNLKRHRDGRTRDRARAVVRGLWELHMLKPTEPAPLPGSPDITIEVLLDDGWHERQPNNDAEIIDQALNVQELTGQPVILAAGDYLQLYRAASVSLTAALMPRPDEAAGGSSSTAV